MWPRARGLSEHEGDVRFWHDKVCFIIQNFMLQHKCRKPQPVSKVKELTHRFWAPMSSCAGQRNPLVHNMWIFNLYDSCTDFTPLSAICSFLSRYNLPNSVLIHHVPRSARIEHSLTWHGWRDDPSHRFKRNGWSVLTVLAGPSHPLHVFCRPLGVDVSPPQKADPGGTFARRPRSHILMSWALSDMSPCTHNLN